MLKLIKKVLKQGPATVAYPAAPLDLAPNFRGKPQYDAQQCIACGACANACPSNALSMTTDVESGQISWSLFLGRCIFCARCEEVCPTAAIRLSQDFELAVWRKEDLFERADFSICHCRKCAKPYAPQKEIDYAMALLEENNGLSAQQIEAMRDRFETCPACKQQAQRVYADQIDVGRHLSQEVNS
ncbi:4Fe-4S dicluster domain-containing protein [Rahnella sp. SAP-1]|jgi:hydrogenase-4 component H/formate hydrogenlyase subunit 6|uniref:4Fe-4S dicluster domain-containing protein n=1 Tax=Rouxiella aceris TaxID=2703884 RepID=A0A848MNK3_9GAMM|nr:formate hydrogenlyase complex iron-sulfur subunit [Rouxiella aceris]NMP28903.1 4Fe-4S dicluster domain-containing protein [Rouxiella aceris]